MTKEQKKEILGYLERSVPDIARKCGVMNDVILDFMSEFCNSKLDCSDEFVVVCWPEVQDLMTIEGFDVNSSLANDEWSLEKYGSSAYFVNKEWLKRI